MRSKSCDPYGFSAAPYKASLRDGVVSFEADTVSPKEGRMHWSGKVRGEALEGTAIWTKAGQADIHYWIKATLRK